MARHVLSIDQGTTGSTVMVLGENLEILARANREFEQLYPQPGWVEHDPEKIWESILGALENALGQADVDAKDIAAIGVTNQRETAVLWDRKTGEAPRTAIVWQDRRTAEICQELKQAGHEDRVRKTTGLVLDPYFAGTKLTWMFRDDPKLAEAARNGKLAFGTVDSFVVSRLTGGKVHVTEPSNASRTLLFGLKSLAWEDELLELLEVPRACLPEVKASAEVYGVTRGVPGLPDGIPIAGMAGDQQAALFGQACFAPGEAKCTFGTGSFLLMNTGSEPVFSDRRLLTTVGWKLGAGKEKGEVTYALEGAAFMAGATVQWVRDTLGIIETAADIEALARSVDDSGDVVLVPAFAGLGAPHWRPEARALLWGMTRGTSAGHIARAALEGIALQHHDILDAMQKDSGHQLASLKVDGGAAVNDLLMQLQADVLGVNIARPAIVETTALGAAFLAGLGAGVWQSKADIARVWKQERQFRPEASKESVEKRLSRWHEAVAKA